MADLDMSPGTLNMTVTQGKTWTVTLTARDSAGSAVNLTGYDCAWAMSCDFDSSQAEITATVGGTAGAITLGGTAGTIVLTVPSTVTAGAAVGRWLHEFEITEPGGTKPPFVAGVVTVKKEIVA